MNFKYFSFISLFILIVGINTVHSQKIISELGGLVGTSYYNGDFNPSKPFVSPHILFGAIYKMNLNPRYAIKAQLSKTTLSGQRDLNNREISPIANSKAPFSNGMVSISSSFEMNFLKYDPMSPKYNFTPFLNLGLSYSRFMNANQQKPFHFSMPMGFGIKYMYKNTFDFGIEYSLRKTFSDNIDGDTNFNSYRNNNSDYLSSNYTSILHNNDWYTYISLFITIKFINFAQNCPAYY